MEYQSLREILKSKGGISASQFRMVSVELAGIIAEHHSRSLSHGFLSAERIAISAEGDARILGFGDEPGAEPFDPYPDLQAFGRILYELATGIPADTFYPDLDKLPPELRDIVARAIQGQYASAADIAADLKAFHPASAATIPHAPRKYPWAVAALIVLLVGGVLWKRRHAPAHTDRRAVTVVFFNNLSQDKSLDWLSRGVPEMLTLGLEQTPGVEVISLDRQIETLLRRGQPLATLADPAGGVDVARASGADIAVIGAITRKGSQLALDVRLQDTASGRDRKTFTVPAANAAEIIKAMDSVSRQIAGEVTGKSVAATATLATISTSNADAMHHVMSGRELLRAGGLAEAAKEFGESLRLDAEMPLATFEMARIFRLAGDSSRRYEALLTCGKSLGRLPRFEAMRWRVEMAVLETDNTKTEQALKALVEAFPRDTASRNELALQMAVGNHATAAVKLVEEGLLLDPDDATLLNQMVYATAMAGDEKAMRKASDRYIELHPGDFNALDTRGEAFYLVGDDVEALKAFRELVQQKPDFLDYSSYQKIALVLADQGAIDDAAENLAEYSRRASPDGQRYEAPLYQARLAEASGDNRAAAISYLRAARALSAAGRTEAAGDALLSLANVAVLSKENVAGTLAVIKEQKLLGEELPALAWLQAVTGDSAGAARSLNEYKAARPWLSGGAAEATSGASRMDILTAMVYGYGALASGNNAAASAYFKRVPDENFSWLLYGRALAGAGEPAFKRALITGRALFLPPPLESPSPLRQKLILEKLGGKGAPKGGKTKPETVHV